MNGNASARLSQWWVHGVTADERAPAPVAPVAGTPWTAKLLGRLRRGLWQSDEPRSADDLLAMARGLEREMPNLAAELRMIAMHRPDTHG